MGAPERDAQLKRADFLDVESLRNLSFWSISITQRGEGFLDVEGELTIHGVTRKVIIRGEEPTAPDKDSYGKVWIGVFATTKINHKNFVYVFLVRPAPS